MPAPSLTLVPAAPAPAAVTVAVEHPSDPPEHAALRLLAALQEEGRLIDFFSEDIGLYSDEQIGAATRGIHESCRKALRTAITNACAQLASGVTDSGQCENTPPESVTWR